MMFHSLAMIGRLRKGNLPSELVQKYLRQVEVNQAYIRK